MKARYLYLSFLFSFLVFGICRAEGELSVLEGVEACGYLHDGTRTVGILRTAQGLKIIRSGDTLGDFRVVSLSPVQSFEMVAGGEEYLVEWPQGATPSIAGSGPIQVRLENCDSHYAAKALASLQGRDFFCDPNFAGTLSLSGKFSQSELWMVLLDSAESDLHFTVDTNSGPVVLGTRDKVVRVKKALQQTYQREKIVTLDFINAELYYVLKVLAESELKISGSFPSDIVGEVTICATNTPASALLEASLALQDRRYKIEWSTDGVRVTEL